MTTTTKAWKKEEIRKLLETSDHAVTRGLLNLLALQTDGERRVEATTDKNGVGFNGLDAEFLTGLTKKFITYGKLTPKQMFYARKKILKYAGQLTKVANGEIRTDTDRVIKEVKNGTARY